jgi:hypothetical protein
LDNFQSSGVEAVTTGIKGSKASKEKCWLPDARSR